MGDYDFYTTEQKPTAKRSSGPSVTVTLGPDGAFENDYVKVESDKPVLAYVGPAASDINEYADVAFSVPTGTDSRIIYAYAQNSGSSNDLQIFGFDPDTEVTITSLTRTIGFRTATFHDFTIGPGVGGATGWLEGVSGEVWWGSDVWSGEMLRIESTKPITVINGDYDTPHFGAYIPFVLTTPDLPPVAVADADPSTVCTGDLVSLDGSGSFDQDSLGVDPAIVSYEWDVDISFDSDGDGNPANDVDASGVTPTVSYTSAGTFIVKLTVTDNEGQTDTDFVAIEVEQCNEPPDCSNAAASSDTLWPPNHKMVSINVVGVTDPDGDPITITIDSIFQDEPVDTTGDGKFSPDGKGVGTDTAQVRAERTGNKKVPGNGRVYHIGYTATDDEGAACPPGQLVLVGVPHDQGKGKTPIDDGPLFDSTEFVPGTGDK